MLQVLKLVGSLHKGLAAFYADDDAAKLGRRLVTKLRRQLTFLGEMRREDELRWLQFWKSHRLSDGRWSLHVTANWRLTFMVD